MIHTCFHETYVFFVDRFRQEAYDNNDDDDDPEQHQAEVEIMHTLYNVRPRVQTPATRCLRVGALPGEPYNTNDQADHQAPESTL